MATENETNFLSLPAAAALPRNTFVSMNASGQWAQTAVGARPDAVLERASAGVNDQTRAWAYGRGQQPKLLCGGTFAIGAKLAVGAGGAVVQAVTGNIIVGTAKEPGVAGRYVSILGDVGAIAP